MKKYQKYKVILHHVFTFLAPLLFLIDLLTGCENHSYPEHKVTPSLRLFCPVNSQIL